MADPIKPRLLYTVTLNGFLVKRKTARNYTHAIVNDTKAVSWCGSLDLAEKALKRFQATYAALDLGVRFAVAVVTEQPSA